MSDDVAFHAGEVAVQERLGVRGVAVRMERTVTQAEISPAAREFLATQQLVAAATIDDNGRPAVTLLSGPRGFVHVTGDRNLTICPAGGLPHRLAADLAGPAPLGVTAIDLATRRRGKFKGTGVVSDGRVRLTTARVYPLCPKYIQARRPVGPVRRREERPPLDRLGPTEVAWVSEADTAFVATYHAQTGADASHRGGPPGFITVLDDRHLTWEDYAGNSLFNTIGNLQADPHAALVIPDFSGGRLLELTGSVIIEWREPRRLTFAVEAAVVVDGGLPAQWTAVESSPHNPPWGRPARGERQAGVSPDDSAGKGRTVAETSSVDEPGDDGLDSQAVHDTLLELTHAVEQHFGDREVSEDELRAFLRARLLTEGRSEEEADAFLRDL